MILGQISYLDCLAFVVFLIPQLLIQVNVLELIPCVLQALPFLVLRLPYSFVTERYFTPKQYRSPFVQRATPFQDFVIRCVRYAFAYLPAQIGKVFFSRAVSLPFLRFRMLRHGYLYSPIPWHEVSINGIKGLYMACIETKPPDIIIYYCHGGGFSMGSTYFYLEPLLALLTLLKPHYQNPAIFALEYTLVPEASYPTQLSQTMAGYDHALSLVHNDASRICVAGDSAGATLILSLLLHLAQEPGGQTRRPGYATLISPWVTLASDNNRDTPSDYLSKESLQLYGSQYAATKENLSDPLVSPGCCVYLDWWTRAAPRNGMYIAFGSEEVLGLETRNLISRLEKSGVNISVREYASGIHAWAIASLFLEETIEERIRGMKELAKMVAWNIPHSLIKARAYH